MKTQTASIVICMQCNSNGLSSYSQIDEALSGTSGSLVLSLIG